MTTRMDMATMEDAVTMLDYEVYLEKLSLFGRLLRQEGMEVSPQETEDACRMLIELGFEDRETVKTVFRTIYAKSKDEQLRFDRVFNNFFLSEETLRALYKKQAQEELKKQEAIRQAEEELKDQSENYSEEEKEAYSSLPDNIRQHLQDTKEKYQSPRENIDKLYNQFINSVFKKYILEQQMMMEDAALGVNEALDPELGMMFRDISDFQDKEIPKAVMYIQSIASQINGELTKTKKNCNHSNVLDFRRTIRKGLETGGRFYHLSYKTKRKRRKHLILLCDVSASMIQFSEFALRFIRELNQSAESSRVILFSEESVEADLFHLQNMDLFRDYVRESGIYGRGTNLGKALQQLNDERPSALSPSTILIIVSDGKTVNTSSCCEEIRRARSRSGKVIFLNPIPERKWKYSQAIQTLGECCSMVSCSTLADLGAACRKLLL